MRAFGVLCWVCCMCWGVLGRAVVCGVVLCCVGGVLRCVALCWGRVGCRASSESQNPKPNRKKQTNKEERKAHLTSEDAGWGDLRKRRSRRCGRYRGLHFLVFLIVRLIARFKAQSRGVCVGRVEDGSGDKFFGRLAPPVVRFQCC